MPTLSTTSPAASTRMWRRRRPKAPGWTTTPGRVSSFDGRPAFHVLARQGADVPITKEFGEPLHEPVMIQPVTFTSITDAALVDLERVLLFFATPGALALIPGLGDNRARFFSRR